MNPLKPHSPFYQRTIIVELECVGGWYLHADVIKGRTVQQIGSVTVLLQVGGVEQQLEQPLLSLPKSYHGLIARHVCVYVLSTLLQMTTSGVFMYTYIGQFPDT